MKRQLASDTIDPKFQELFESNQYKSMELDSILKKQLEILNKNEIKDKVLARTLEEIKVSNDPRYTKKLEKIFNDYQAELQKNNKLSKDEIESLNKAKEDFKKYSEAKQTKDKFEEERKRANARVDNPIAVFGQLFDDARNKQVSGKDTVKNLGSGLADTVKNIFSSPTSMMHIAGAALDIPALNILADTFKQDLKAKDKQFEQEANYRKDILESNEDLSDSFKATMQEEQDDISDKREDVKYSLDNFDVLLKPLEEINGNLESIYLDLGSSLENIYSNDKEMKGILRDILFNQIDSNDDNIASNSTSTKADLGSTFQEEEPDSDESSIMDMFGLGDKDKKGKKKRNKSKGFKGLVKGAGSKIGGLAKGAGSLLGKLALPLAAGMAAFQGYQGYNEADETFDLKEGQEATQSEKLSSMGGSIASGLTFGLLDEKTASKGIQDISSTALKYSGVGLIKDLMTDDKSQAIVDELEKNGIIASSLFGDSEIRNWDAIKKLSKDDLDSLIKYDDWDDKDLKQMEDIKNMKSKEVKIPEPKSDLIKDNSTAKANSVEITEPKVEKQMQQQMQQPAPVVIQQPIQQPKAEVKYNIEDNDLIEILTLKGFRV